MKIALSFQESEQRFSTEYDSLQIVHTGDLPAYEGDYEVTPLAASAVVLETNGKRMTDDVTVKKVPYFETSNPGGGYTAYIATEV